MAFYTLKDIATDSLENLGELLIAAKKAYYTGGSPIMDDHTYDTLEEILKQKNPYHRIFTNIGHPNFDTGFAKKKHLMAMGSQNKVATLKDLTHYFKLKKLPPDTDFIVQPKCDGISLEIIYQNSTLIEAITRGDGLVGDVITQNVVKMKNFVEIPSRDFTGSVRCEIVVTQKDFLKLNSISPEKYSNSRNAASGLSQRLDSKYSEYCSLYAVDTTFTTSTEQEKIVFLKSSGFTTVESHLCHNFDQIETVYQEFFSKKRTIYPYEIDGLVIKINSLELQHRLGSKNNRPKGQVAYKFPARTNLTQIISVSWQVGPLGTITPVAQVEPIEISGAIVSFASLANYDLIKEKDLNLGDIVEISRRGDVIPHIDKVITKVSEGHLSFPQTCPSCHRPLITDHKFLRCPNDACLAQILGRLRLFCDTLEIKGLSEKTITKLYQAHRIKLPGDFYKLTVNDIKDLENLGEKSAKNIIHQIQSKKTITLKQVIDAACVPNFSSARIKQLINAGFNTPSKITNLTIDNLLSLPGFQITLARKIIDGLHRRLPEINSILSQVKISDHRSLITNHQLQDLSFSITGDLSRPRKQVIEDIESAGGKFVSAISSNTNYLVTNETDSNSSKFITAKKLSISIISEDRLYQMIQS